LHIAAVLNNKLNVWYSRQAGRKEVATQT